MPIPTVMRWDHKNSPKITNSNDWEQIKAWYQTIFVDGYLADDDTTLIAGLGWDYSFDDGAKFITLTMDSAGDPNIVNKSRILFKYKNKINNSYIGLKGAFYEHLDNLEIVRFGQENEDANGGGYALPLLTGTNNNGTNQVCPYVVIGTNRGVYFLSGYNATIEPVDGNPPFSTIDGYSAWHYFGDFVNDGVDYGRNNQCSHYCYWYDEGNTGYYFANNIKTQVSWDITANKNKIITFDHHNHYMGVQVARDHNGNTRGLNYSATPFMYGYDTVHLGANGRFALKYPYVDGGLKIVPHELWVRNNLELPVYYDLQQVYIGKMPGLYYPLHFRPLGYDGNTNNLVEFEGSGEFEGQEFIGLAKKNADEFYINVTENWDI